MTGRSESFEELVHRYQRPITGYVFRMLGDYESSLDVTQEVFIKVYNSLSKYSDEYKFSTWLYRIAHNAAIDHMRRNSNARPRASRPKMLTAPFNSRSKAKSRRPNRITNAANGEIEIDAVVRCLPNAYRDLIILRHSRELSYDEIAEVTDLPLGTVKNRLFRAREMMRELFIERGFKGI